MKKYGLPLSHKLQLAAFFLLTVVLLAWLCVTVDAAPAPPSPVRRSSCSSVTKLGKLCVDSSGALYVGNGVNATAQGTGATGPAGAPGTNGSQITWGTSAPSNSTGVLNDFHINTATWQVFQRGASVWALKGVIKGADGSNGTNGVNGTAGAPGANGTNGTSPVITIGTVTTVAVGGSANATLTGTSANPVLNLWLVTGATGATGANGSQGIQGIPGVNGTDGINANNTFTTLVLPQKGNATLDNVKRALSSDNTTIYIGTGTNATGMAKKSDLASYATTASLGTLATKNNSTLTDSKVCTWSSANGLTCNSTSGGTGDVTASGTPTLHQWAVWTTATAIKGASVTASKVVCTDANGEPTACSNLTDVAYQTALTYPVTGPASPTAGQLVKWGASGDALVDLALGNSKVACTSSGGLPVACTNLTDTAIVSPPSAGVVISSGSTYSAKTNPAGPFADTNSTQSLSGKTMNATSNKFPTLVPQRFSQNTTLTCAQVMGTMITLNGTTVTSLALPRGCGGAGGYPAFAIINTRGSGNTTRICDRVCSGTNSTAYLDGNSTTRHSIFLPGGNRSEAVCYGVGNGTAGVYRYNCKTLHGVLTTN